MRVWISGSPTLELLQPVQIVDRGDRCAPAPSASMPSGFETNSTGSPLDRNSTPWCTVGRKPLPQQDLPPSGLFSPESSTTNAGRSCALAAEPVTEPRAEARPADHLVAGVHEDLRRRVVELRRLHRPDDGDVVGDLRQVAAAARRSPRPTARACWNWNGEPSSFGVPLMNAKRSPLTNSAGMSCPSCFVSAAWDRRDRAATARRP